VVSPTSARLLTIAEGGDTANVVLQLDASITLVDSSPVGTEVAVADGDGTTMVLTIGPQP
jgi:hypothetical protein